MGHEKTESVNEKQFNHQLYGVRGEAMDRISFGKKNSFDSLSILVQFKGILKMGMILKGIGR